MRTRAAWLGRILAAAILVAVSTGLASPGGAATEGSFTVTVSKQTGLADGEVVNIDLIAPADSGAHTLVVGMCRPGHPYTTIESLSQNAGNCVSETNSGAVGSGDAGARGGEDIQALVQRRGHVQIPWAVGTGTSEWTNAEGSQSYSLTCDEKNPCTLVVLVRSNLLPVAFAFDLTFRSTDALASCGGAATGALASSHPFRLSELWSTQTAAACQSAGATGALSQSVATGEDENLRAYAEGTDDITYSGVGFHDLAALKEVTPRASVAVPIGLNAAVFAVGGGIAAEDGSRQPYVGLQFTVDEVGQIMSGGMARMKIDPYRPLKARWDAIVARNPVLTAFTAGSEFAGTGEFNASGYVNSPFALANGDAASWVLTNHLKTTMGDGWREYPYFDPDEDDVLLPRGVELALGPAKPPYPGDLFNGLPTMRKGLQAISNPRTLQQKPPIVVATDLVSARSLNLEPTSISTGIGGSTFVTPTPESMAAAVPTMVVDDQGMRLPNPAAAADGIYAMTYVEYALVPAAALSDPCKQQNLHTWLNFLTGPGQQRLPAGMVPLTAELAAEAKAAIAKVPTGVCGGTTPNTTIGPGPGGGGGGGGGSASPGAGGSSAGSGIDPATGLPFGESTISDATETAAAAPTTTAPVLAVVAPEFAGNRTSGALITVGAMLGLALLTTLAALYSSGKLPGLSKPGGGEPEIIPLDSQGHDIIELT